MKIESTVSFEAEEIRGMAEREAEATYPAPDGMRWVATAKYSYIPDVCVKLVPEKDEPERVEDHPVVEVPEAIETIAVTEAF